MNEARADAKHAFRACFYEFSWCLESKILDAADKIGKGKPADLDAVRDAIRGLLNWLKEVAPEVDKGTYRAPQTGVLAAIARRTLRAMEDTE